MALDWTAPLCTKHETPRMGRLLEPDPLNAKQRVGIFPPSCSTPTNEPYLVVFRYYEDGHTRGDGQPSDNDLVNYDPEDGCVRMDLTGHNVVCRKAAA